MKPFTYPVFAILLLSSAAFSQRQDSVKVVKGQISDYAIPTQSQAFINGTVVDSAGNPLHGATVMFAASPVHCNTANDGSFTLKASPYDSTLMVFYPGMEIRYHDFRNGETFHTVVMRERHRHEPAGHSRIATEWFDPAHDEPNTYCNPTNISYNFEPFNNNVIANGSFRSAADPILVNYKGEYFLFSTNQGGFHWSDDLTKWHFVPASFQRYPTDDDQCAPAAYVSGDTLFYTGSTYKGLPVWYSTNPKSGAFKRMTERTVLPFWDPAFLLDDDGRLYMYYGSSNEYPLKGVEVSRKDFYPVSEVKEIMRLHPDKNGWERFGMNNDDSTTLEPFTEGAWVNKHKGQYYFQYGAPGTEFKVYADGVYVSDHPLGPFTFQKHNPVSYKPGGFVQGAGHGATFADAFGNYWHTATCMLSLKYKFERRIGIYPAGFDEQGIMYTITAFGDYPTFVPHKAEDHLKSNFTGWMLLSYHKSMHASSSLPGLQPNNTSDEDIRTFWSAYSGNPGEWLSIDLGDEKEVWAIQVNYYDYKAVQHNKAMDLYHQYRIYYSLDGKDWKLTVDKSDNSTDVPHDYVELKRALHTRYLKIENIHMASGNFAISDLRVFGTARGDKPEPVRSLKVKRSKKDSRNAFITWKPVDGAYGYNLYFGVEPEKLYSCITVNGDNQYDLRGLITRQDYYFSIEALGETGISDRSAVVRTE